MYTNKQRTMFHGLWVCALCWRCSDVQNIVTSKWSTRTKKQNEKQQECPNPRCSPSLPVCCHGETSARFYWCCFDIHDTLHIHMQHKCKANILEIQNRDKTNKIRYNDAVCWWDNQFMKYYKYITHLHHLQNKYNATAIKEKQQKHHMIMI